MIKILILCIIIVIVVLLLTLLTTNKAYKYEHTVDPIDDDPLRDDNSEQRNK